MDYMHFLYNNLSQNVARQTKKDSKKEEGATAEQNQMSLNQQSENNTNLLGGITFQSAEKTREDETSKNIEQAFSLNDENANNSNMLANLLRTLAKNLNIQQPVEEKKEVVVEDKVEENIFVNDVAKDIEEPKEDMNFFNVVSSSNDLTLEDTVAKGLAEVETTPQTKTNLFASASLNSLLNSVKITDDSAIAKADYVDDTVGDDIIGIAQPGDIVIDDPDPDEPVITGPNQPVIEESTGRMWIGGEPANGEVDGLMYQDGYLFTGEMDGVVYEKGIKTGYVDPEPVVIGPVEDDIEEPVVTTMQLSDGSTIMTTKYPDGSYSNVTTDANGFITGQEGMVIVPKGEYISSEGYSNSNLLPINVRVTNPTGEAVQVTYSIDADGNVTINSSGLEFKADNFVEIPVYAELDENGNPLTKTTSTTSIKYVAEADKESDKEYVLVGTKEVEVPVYVEVDADGNFITQTTTTDSAETSSYVYVTNAEMDDNKNYKYAGTKTVEIPMYAEVENVDADGNITFATETVTTTEYVTTEVKEEGKEYVFAGYKQIEMPMTNITFIGDNNVITGSEENDKITVKGNNNKVDLKAGDDNATITGDSNKVDMGKGEDVATVRGDNNSVSNVEDLLTQTWLVPAGEKGSKEWVEKLWGSDMEITNAKYDEQGRLISFKKAKTLTAPFFSTENYQTMETTEYTIDYSDFGTDIKEVYSKYGFISKTTGELADPKTVTTKSFDIDDNCYYESKMTTDKAGNTVSSHQIYDGGAWETDTENTWDENNNLLSSTQKQFVNGELKSTYVDNFEYDANGRQVAWNGTDFDENGVQTSRYESSMTYFDNGNIATETWTRWGAEGELEADTFSNFWENGNLQTYNNIQFTAGVQTSSTVTEYSEDGAFVSRTGEVNIQSGSTQYVEGLALTNKGDSVNTVTYTYTADGHLELNANNMDITPSYRQLWYVNDIVDMADDADVLVKADENTEASLVSDECIYIGPRFWAPTMENVTINGNGNNITGGRGDDNITVKGNNNVVDLAAGDDTLNIVGNNNRIKHVENVNMNPTEPEPVVVGSEKWVEKLWGEDLDITNAQYDDQGRLTSFDLAGDWIGSVPSFQINYWNYEDGIENAWISKTQFAPTTGGEIRTEKFIQNDEVTQTNETKFRSDGQFLSSHTTTVYGHEDFTNTVYNGDLLESTSTEMYYNGELINIYKDSYTYDEQGRNTRLECYGYDAAGNGGLNCVYETGYDENGNVNYQSDINFYENGQVSYSREKTLVDGVEQTDTIIGYDENGNVNYTVVDNFPSSDPPCVCSWGITEATIYFEPQISSDGSYYSSPLINVSTGEKAVINSDGTVEVTKADGTVVKFDKDGMEIADTPVIQPGEVGSFEWLQKLLPNAQELKAQYYNISYDNTGRISKLEYNGTINTVLDSYAIEYNADGSCAVSIEDAWTKEITVKKFDKDGMEIADTPVIQPGEVGSVEFATTLLTKLNENFDLENYDATYDEQGRVVKFAGYDVSYNEDGRIALSVTEFDELTGITTKRIKYFDETGNLLEEKEIVTNPEEYTGYISNEYVYESYDNSSQDDLYIYDESGYKIINPKYCMYDDNGDLVGYTPEFYELTDSDNYYSAQKDDIYNE